MHTSLMCFNKPRLPLKKESDKTKSKRTATRRKWFVANPPSDKGTWTCYLNIDPQCPRLLTTSTIQLEHVKSKVRYPELRYDITNLKPACRFCNKLKGSKDLEEVL